VIVAIEERLRKGEQCFAAAKCRNDLRAGVDAGKLVAHRQPVRYCRAQRIPPQRQRVAGERVQVPAQRIADELRCRMPGFSDRKVDGRECGGRRDAGKQRAQFLEWIRLQQIEARVH
jgi:hypothetical protein